MYLTRFLLLFVFFAGGCVRFPAPKHSRLAAPLPSFATIPKESLQASNVVVDFVVSTNRRFTLRSVGLLSFIEHGGTNKVQELECWIPRGQGPFPVINILPVSQGEDYLTERHMGRYLAARGFAAVLVRRDKKPKELDPPLLNLLLFQSIRDVVRVIDWIETEPRFDASRVGLYGTSMGAIRGAMLAAVDARIKALVLCLGGGDIPYIISHSADGRKGRGISGQRARYLAREGITLAEGEERLRKAIEWDPLILAPAVDPKEVLLILGAFDRVVPFKTGWALREAMGKPATIVFPTGHYGAILGFWYIQEAALEFFRSRLK